MAGYSAGDRLVVFLRASPSLPVPSGADSKLAPAFAGTRFALSAIETNRSDGVLLRGSLGPGADISDPAFKGWINSRLATVSYKAANIEVSKVTGQVKPPVKAPGSVGSILSSLPGGNTLLILGASLVGVVVAVLVFRKKKG